jgi:hypothetical protein
MIPGNYQRKKFFYKFFLRKSPRNAALFGFSWSIFYLSLIPLFIFTIIPRLIALELELLAAVAVFTGVFLVVLLPYAYGLCVLGYAYTRMVKRYFSPKWLRGIGSLCALFYQTGGLVLIPVLIKQRHWGFAVSGAVSLICAGTVFAQREGFLPFAIGPYAVWGLTLCCTITLIIAIAGFGDKHKLKLRYLWPLGLLVLYVAGLRLYNAKLYRDILLERALISQMLGHSIEVEDYWAGQNQGVPLDSEPLRSLIAYAPERNHRFVLNPALKAIDYQQKLKVFKKTNPEFVNAVNAMVKLPPQNIRHPYTDETLASVELPELNALRKSAWYLYYELVANSTDRSEVLRRNAELEIIRDWCLADTSLIARLVAVAVEKIRLDSLSYPLAAGTLNTNDWKNILQKKAQWGVAFADAIADEATSFQSCYEYIVFRQFNKEPVLSDQLSQPEKLQSSVKKYLPLEFSIHFKRDYLFSLREFQKLIKLFLAPGNLTAKERYERAAPDSISIRKNFFILSGMLLPALNGIYIRQGEIEDCRRLVALAVAVENYRKANGKLPVSLAFLPEQPLDSLNRLPIIYEYGKLRIRGDKRKIQSCYGFRLYTRDRDGKDPGGLKARNAFTVVLNNTELQSGSK